MNQKVLHAFFNLVTEREAICMLYSLSGQPIRRPTTVHDSKPGEYFGTQRHLGFPQTLVWFKFSTPVEEAGIVDLDVNVPEVVGLHMCASHCPGIRWMACTISHSCKNSQITGTGDLPQGRATTCPPAWLADPCAFLAPSSCRAGWGRVLNQPRKAHGATYCKTSKFPSMLA